MGAGHLEGARKRKENKIAISDAVDKFFAERKIKQENYVPKEMKPRQLPSGLYELFFPDGGDLPRYAQGGFTSLFEVQKIIEKFNLLCRAKQG